MLPVPSPSPASGRPAPADRLDGWKAIAGHLNRDIRTVQRWERYEHLPVYRLAHQKQPSAYAFRSELDEWLRERTIPTRAIEPPAAPAATPRRGRAWLISVVAWTGALFAAIIVVRAFHSSAAPPAGRETKDTAAYVAFAEGQALYNARRYRSAVPALERAVLLDPGYGSGWALLGKTYGRLAQWPWAGGPTALAHATDVSARAERVSPNVADTHIALALAARAREDVSTWRTEAQRAIALDPLDAEAYAILGDYFSTTIYSCNEHENNPELADSYYRKALDLKPDMTIAVENRASNLWRLGRYDECVDLLDTSLTRLNDDTPLFLIRGRCLVAEGEFEAAARDIEPLRDNPKVAPLGALVGLGLLALARGDIETGTRDLERIVGANVTPQLELSVAEVYARVRMIHPTVVHMERAFDMNRACVGAVTGLLQFRSVLDEPEVKTLLAKYDAR